MARWRVLAPRVAARVGRHRRDDPWDARGWRTPCRWLVAAGVSVGLFVTLAVLTGWDAADQWQYERYERGRYDLATGGTAVATDDTPIARFHGRRIGTVDLHWSWFQPGAGETVTVKINPRDPSDYLFENEHAQPLGPTLEALAWAAGAALATGVVAVVVRRGRLDAEPALDAAAPPDEPARPPPVDLPEAVAATKPRVGPGFLVGAAAGLLVVLVIPTGIPQPVYQRVEGRVVDGMGSLDVEFFDPRVRQTWARPLTSREAAGLRPGDTFAWDIAIDENDGQFGPNAPNVWLGAGWVGVVAARRARWRRALARAAATRAHPEPVAGWVRVRRGTTWLALAPYGSTRVRDVRLVPIHHMSPVPDAVRNILWVRGPLRRGAAVVVHTPGGIALWPSGRVRGPVAAAMLGTSPWAPLPPGAPPEPQTGA